MQGGWVLEYTQWVEQINSIEQVSLNTQNKCDRRKIKELILMK